MKKNVISIAAFLAIPFLLSACTPNEPTGSASTTDSTVTTSSNDSKLIAVTQPTNFRLVDGTLHWDDVKGAAGYHVVFGTNTFDTKSSKVDLRDDLKNGENAVQVTALGDGTVTKDSEAASVTLQGTQLDTPVVTVDQEAKAFRWNAVNGATSYRVSYADGVWENVTATTYSFDSYGRFELKVVANGDYNGLSFTLDSLEGSAANALEIVPPAPTNLALANGVLSWDAEVGATAYRVSLDGQVLSDTVADKFYDVSSVITTAGDHNLSVESGAAGGVWSAKVSFAYTATILATPIVAYATTDADGPHFTWDAVENATAYQVYLNGQYTDTVTTTIYYPPEVGTYSIQVKALGAINGHSFYVDSPLSTASDDYEFVAGPVLTVNADKTVTITGIDGADSYGLICDGVKLADRLTADTAYDLIKQGLITKTGIYNLRASAYKGTACIGVGAVAAFNTGRINENELYSFDDAPGLDTFDPIRISVALEDKIIHGDRGYSLKVTTDATNDYCFLDMPLRDVAEDMKKATKITYWAYVVRPEGVTVCDGAKLFGVLSNNGRQPSGGGWQDPVYYEGASLTSGAVVPFGQWVQLSMNLSADNSFVHINEGTIQWLMYPVDDTFGYGQAVAATIYVDDIEYFVPSPSITEQFPVVIIGNGSNDPTKTLQYWSFPNLTLKANTKYSVDVTFSAMNTDGSKLTGNGAWGRRIQWDGSAKAGAAAFYALSNPGAPITYSYEEDGVYQMPDPDDVCSFSYTTTTNDEGKLPIYLLDFLENEFVGVRTCTATKVTA